VSPEQQSASDRVKVLNPSDYELVFELDTAADFSEIWGPMYSEVSAIHVETNLDNDFYMLKNGVRTKEVWLAVVQESDQGQPTVCIDTDGGNKPKTAGSVKFQDVNGNVMKYQDKCLNTGKLLEYACNEKGNLEKHVYECGCSIKEGYGGYCTTNAVEEGQPSGLGPRARAAPGLGPSVSLPAWVKDLENSVKMCRTTPDAIRRSASLNQDDCKRLELASTRIKLSQEAFLAMKNFENKICTFEERDAYCNNFRAFVKKMAAPPKKAVDEVQSIMGKICKATPEAVRRSASLNDECGMFRRAVQKMKGLESSNAVKAARTVPRRGSSDESATTSSEKRPSKKRLGFFARLFRRTGAFFWGN
jgi:hypothetical protein